MRTFALSRDFRFAPSLVAMPQNEPTSPELWGGVECTVNRIGDEYHDQDERSGHSCRPADFDLFASLGLKAIRHAVLWEKVKRGLMENADWGVADRSLSKIRALNIRPIVGLVHHGSGPRHTQLADELFPIRLAEY